MASPSDSTPVADRPVQPGKHFETVKRKIPQWLMNASPELRREVRKAGRHRLPWFEDARQSMPDVVAALREDHESHRRDEQALNKALEGLPSLGAFAEPLLVAAIKKRFNLSVDVRKTYLFHARRAQVDQSFASASKDPLVELQNALTNATQSLLRAALQNFESWEAQSGGMDLDSTRKAAIYPTYPVFGVAITGTPLNIAPEAFAALCRKLDLGGQYQKKIAAFLSPAATSGQTPEAARSERQALIDRIEQSAFRIQVHLAYMRSRISERFYKALLQVMPNGGAPQATDKAVRFSFLKLWDVELTGIVAIGITDNSSPPVTRVAVYIPDDPAGPLKEYESIAAFTLALRDRMLSKGYSGFFQRFVPARDQARFFAKLNACLWPKVWNRDMGWYENQADGDARLPLLESTLSGALLTAITRQKANVLKDDALFHAVPTADEDQKTFDQRVHYFENLALQALNVVGFVVPAVGAVMMVVAAVQLGYEVYEGIDSWTRGEWEQGWGYLLDVAENVALMAALGAAHASIGGTPAVEVIPVETPSFIEELDEVDVSSGESRLWKPDLAPFAHDTVLPADVKPDEFGIYHYQDKTWLALEDKVYSVRQSSSTGAFQLEHPTKINSYQPPLRSNGAGAWLHPLDRPLEWEGLKLFRRLGHEVAAFSDTQAKRILWVSDTHEAVLRRTLAESERPAALLQDTIARFGLDQAVQGDAPASTSSAGKVALFDARYQALQSSREVSAGAIIRRYPKLPTVVADELIRGASASELQSLALDRVPLRVAEEVRVYQQQIRLARAYEGLYLESTSSPDTDVLILHTLETLPGWSADVRVELRQGHFTGTLLDAVGPSDAVVKKVLAKVAQGYEAYDAQGLELHGRDDLYSSILHALPDAERAAIGFPGTWEGPGLKASIQSSTPLPRQKLRKLLKMEPLKPGSKSPMRLAQGRRAYPLSGTGTLPGFITRDTLLDLIGVIGVLHADTSSEQVLSALEAAGMTRQQIHQRLIQVLQERNALDVSLNAWGDASAAIPDLSSRLNSRIRIHDAIWQHWAQNTLPEAIPDRSALRLDNVVLSDFPAALPEFFNQRVTGLELRDISVSRPVASGAQSLNQLFDNGSVLRQFFERFPNVTTLEMSRAEASTRVGLALAYAPTFLIEQCFPALETLRLVNQDILVSDLTLGPLLSLEHLHTLDLSANTISSTGPTFLASLRLRYLGLDNMRLDRWPGWFEALPWAHLRELSLRNNNMIEVPRDVVAGLASAGGSTHIAMQGNPLSRLTLMRIGLNEAPSNRLRFGLDMPVHLGSQIAFLKTERAQLQEATSSWAESSSSSQPMSEATLAARREIGQTLLDFWLACAEGQTQATLELKDISLADFPARLPSFFYTYVRNLHLSQVGATDAQLNRFLASFPQLTSLELVGQTEPVYDIPSVLPSLSQLTGLSLRGQGRVIDQQAIDLFARIPRLDTLELSGNRLGVISDVSGLRPRLLWLSLESMHLDSWPEWLEDLLPLEGLVLDNNQLTELPEFILENPRNNETQTEIGLRGNPLSHETMRRAHLSERHNGSYSFVMDLPDDILQLPPEHPNSDSDIEEYLSDSVVTDENPATPVDVDQWLLGAVDENAAHRALWERIEGRGDADNLMALIGRLTQSAPYRSSQTRVGYSERVWRVLEAADQNEENRLLYNGIAQEALVQADTGSQTCHDGAWLVFNQIEVQMFIEQSLANVSAESRGQSLYRLTRRLYRLHELDAVAREQAQGRDEAEVRLAYRLRWSTELDLPLPPSGMLYQVHASIRPSELETALTRVQQGEHGEPFMQYAAQRDFWIEYLREVYAERFEALKQDYLRRVVELPDHHPGLTIEELSDQFAALKHEHETQELNLIRELTYREGFDQT